ncbi:MAG: hypothetical protein ACRBCI_07150 [Cellvibrionaceae bacterium]
MESYNNSLNHLSIKIFTVIFLILLCCKGYAEPYGYSVDSESYCYRERVCNKKISDISHSHQYTPIKDIAYNSHPIYDDLSFEIIYNSIHRELYIYGDQEEENFARVEIVESSPLVYQKTVKLRVTLNSGGVASGNSIVEDFILYTPAEAIPSSGSKNSSSSSPQPLIVEIYFNGGSQNNRFENLTNIPSWASGEEGDDVFIGGSSIDHFFGNAGNDRLDGNAGNDRLDGGFGNDVLRGGAGNDWLKVKATQNVADANLLCGGDGADHLIAAPGSIVNNDLHSELTDNEDDGYEDILEGYSSTGTATTYFFTASDDTIIENGNTIEEDSFSYPTPAFIDCGS